MAKGTYDNDNDELPFITLGVATLNVVRYLEKDRDQAPHSEADKNPKDEADAQRFIETRLREIERFERVASGEDRPRRKRN